MRTSMLAAAGVAVAAGALVPALGHGFGGEGLSEGLAHPLVGADHLLAMVTVGLWSAQRGGRSLWAVPLAFMAAMAAGGLSGLAGLDLPGVEWGILASLAALGGLVAGAVRLPVAAGMAVVALFGLFHGHAHGTELPEAASPALYAAGFLLATGILHLAGLALAQMAGKALSAPGERLVRGAGVAVASSAVVLLLA